VKLGFALSLFISVIFFPVASNAVMRGMPDDSSLRVHVGDAAPLTSPELKKAHAEGKAIVLMFGNVDQCLYCERNWVNILFVTQKYSKDTVAIIIDYLPAELSMPNPADVAVADQYGLIGEPWIFLIDKKGIIRHIFQSFTGVTALNDELIKMKLELNPALSTK
jgi:thioredoxin-related protein